MERAWELCPPSFILVFTFDLNLILFPRHAVFIWMREASDSAIPVCFYVNESLFNVRRAYEKFGIQAKEN